MICTASEIRFAELHAPSVSLAFQDGIQPEVRNNWQGWQQSDPKQLKVSESTLALQPSSRLV